MKIMNLKINVILLLMVMWICQSNLLAQTQTSNATLTDALQKATESALRNAERNQRIAILHVTSPSDEVYEFILDELQSILVSSGYRVMNRNPIKEILTDLQIGVSSEIDDAVAVNIGTHVDADFVLVGSIDQANRRVRLRVLDKNSDTVGIATERFTNINIEMFMGNQPQGNNLREQFAWISNQAENEAIYNIIINNDVSLPPTIISTKGRNITINLQSENPTNARTIQLNGQGSLFAIDTNITLILQDIVLRGHNNNNVALVFIGYGGKMILNSGSKVTENTNTSNTATGGGILVDGGVLELNDGAEISKNTVKGGNSTDPHRGEFGAWDAQGGGIYAGNRSVVTIRGGLITENKSDTRGGARGGGMFVADGSTVNMTGGVISKNTCTVGYAGYRFGGGVFVYDSASTFTKRAAPGSDSSGIIYGSSGPNANTATDGGHAIFRHFANPKQHNNTLGYHDEINTSTNVGWQ